MHLHENQRGSEGLTTPGAAIRQIGGRGYNPARGEDETCRLGRSPPARLRRKDGVGDVTSARSVTLHKADLPFDLEISHFMTNCFPEPKNPGFMVTSPVVEGIFLRPVAVRPAQEQNIAGLYAVAVDNIRVPRIEEGTDP